MIELVAQAVTDELNNGTWSKDFTAVRSYADWDVALEGTACNLICDVVPVTYEDANLEDRGAVLWVCPVDVVFRRLMSDHVDKKTGRLNVAAVDDYVAFNREIYLHFMRSTRIQEEFKRTSQEWVSAYGRVGEALDSLLRTHHQWTGVFRLTYSVTDDLG